MTDHENRGQRKRSAIHGPYSGPLVRLLSPKMLVFLILLLLVIAWLEWNRAHFRASLARSPWAYNTHNARSSSCSMFSSSRSRRGDTSSTCVAATATWRGSLRRRDHAEQPDGEGDELESLRVPLRVACATGLRWRIGSASGP